MKLVLCRCASEQAHVDEDLRDSGLSGGGAGAGSDRTLCETNRKGEGNRAKVRGIWVRGTYVPGTSLRYWVIDYEVNYETQLRFIIHVIVYAHKHFAPLRSG